MVLRGALALTVAKVLGEVVHQFSLMLRPSLRLVVVDRAGDAAMVCKTILASVDAHTGASLTATNPMMASPHPMSLHVVRIFASRRTIVPRCIRALWCACCEGFNIAVVACDPGSRPLVRVHLQTFLKGIVEDHALCHALVLGVAELSVELVLVGLLHEEDQVWVVRLFYDSRDVHRVVDLVFRLKHFFKTEVVVTLLQSVKRYVLVVLSEDIVVTVFSSAPS